MNKYKLKSNEKQGNPYYRVCLVCGKKELGGHKTPGLPLPNSTETFEVGAIGFRSGTKRACWTGNHSWKFEHEVEFNG